MSKPLPNCHWCGKTMKRTGKFLFTFHGKKFAWHPGERANTDPLFNIACKGFFGKMKEDVAIEILEARTKK